MDTTSTVSRSVRCVVSMAQGLGIEQLPLSGRSDEWWTEFWRRMGLKEAERLKGKV